MKTALEEDKDADKRMTAKQLAADIKSDKKTLAAKKKAPGAKTVLDSAYRGK